jgi:hypothetical protein
MEILHQKSKLFNVEFYDLFIYKLMFIIIYFIINIIFDYLINFFKIK